MKSKITFQDIVKLLIIIVIGFLLFRMINLEKTNSQLEGYTNQLNNQIPNHFGNLIPVSNIKYNNSTLNTVTLTLNETIKLESIHLVINNTEASNQLIQLFSGNVISTNDINNNQLSDSFGNTEFQLLDSTSGKSIKLNDIYGSSRNKVLTNKITLMLEGGSNFTISDVKVYGMSDNSPNRNMDQLKYLTNYNTNSYNKSHSTDRENPDKDIYRYTLENPINLYVINFNASMNNYNSRNPPPLEIHYQAMNDVIYKININLYLNNQSNYIFLPIPILCKKIYIRVLRTYQNGDSITQISGISNELFLGKPHNVNNFTNVENNANPRMVGSRSQSSNENSSRENFSAIGGYSADDMCPNLSAIEDKLRLTDQICARLEYNDKIRNERIKLERNKQYILKLKQQDDEIKKLEKVIRSLQDKREDRDAYNDALRLAQFNKQKKQAAVIRDLAEERDRLRKNNVINVQMNLRRTPRQTSAPTTSS